MSKTDFARPRRAAGVLVAALAAICVLAPAASADRIGSPSVGFGSGDTFGCTNGGAACIVTQDELDNDQSVNVVPAGHAVLTGFNVEDASGSFSLVVLRQNGGTIQKVAWTNDITGEPGYQGYNVSGMRVQPGDFIGVKLAAGARIGVLNAANPDTNAWEFNDAATLTLIDATQPYELLLDATVEEDRDGDGLGDDSQDPDGGFPDTGGGGDGGGFDFGGTPDVTEDPLAALRAGGRPGARILGKKLKASKKGAIKVSVRNPNGYRIKGRLSLKAKKRKAGSKAVSIASYGRKTVRFKLPRGVFRTLKRRGRMTFVATLKVKGPIGKSRTVRKKLSIKAPPKPKKKKRRRGGGGGGGGGGGYTPFIPCVPHIEYDADGWAHAVPC